MDLTIPTSFLSILSLTIWVFYILECWRDSEAYNLSLPKGRHLPTSREAVHLWKQGEKLDAFLHEILVVFWWARRIVGAILQGVIFYLLLGVAAIWAMAAIWFGFLMEVYPNPPQSFSVRQTNAWLVDFFRAKLSELGEVVFTTTLASVTGIFILAPFLEFSGHLDWWLSWYKPYSFWPYTPRVGAEDLSLLWIGCLAIGLILWKIVKYLERDTNWLSFDQGLIWPMSLEIFGFSALIVVFGYQCGLEATELTLFGLGTMLVLSVEVLRRYHRLSKEARRKLGMLA